jgi:hypothetical protein
MNCDTKQALAACREGFPSGSAHDLKEWLVSLPIASHGALCHGQSMAAAYPLPPGLPNMPPRMVPEFDSWRSRMMRTASCHF